MADKAMSLKTCFIGNQDVGKTSVIFRITTGLFQIQCSPTIGASYSRVILDVDDHRVRFQIWDTAGQERFRAVASMYYRMTDVAVIVYDITSTQSFKDLNMWLSELRKYVPEDNYLLCVVGNKCDLTHQRVVEREKAEAYAEYIGALYFETSAKTGEGVAEIFNQVSRQLINAKEMKQRRLSRVVLEEEQNPANKKEGNSEQDKNPKSFCCF